ncbi:MAG: DUF3084 domain-containing protein [Fimbriimonadaceae bacterium]
MDASSIGFLATIILASGGIAYFADWLGRKLGKKRLTFGRLRPRHTAALGTVLSGMIISTLTIVILMISSADVRDWIIKGNAAIREAKAAQTLAVDLRGQLATLVGQKGQMEAQVKLLQGSIATLNQDVAVLRKESAEAKAKLAEATERLAGAQGRLAAAETQVRKAAGQVAEARATMKSAQTARKKAVGDRDYAIKEMNDAQKRAAEIDQELREKERQLSDAQTQLTDRQREMDELDKRFATLTSTLNTTQSDLVDANQDLDQVNRQLELSKIELDKIRSDVKALTIGLEGNLYATRRTGLVVLYGQELARIQLPPGQTPNQVRAMLENVLSHAAKTAEELGVKPARSGVPAANLRDQMPEGKLITVEQQKQAVISAAANQNEESVIIASAFWNVFEGEDVPLMVAAYRNPLVYTQGQIIAETMIDGRRDDQAILTQLTEFLRVKVKQKALADKMIPAAGREQSLGEVTFEELFALTRDIKGTNRQVRLVAVAKQDTRAADPLRMDLRMR